MTIHKNEVKWLSFAITKAQTNAEQGSLEIDISQARPAPDNMIEATRVGLQKALGIKDGCVSVEVAASTSVEEARAISMTSGNPFGVGDLHVK